MNFQKNTFLLLTSLSILSVNIAQAKSTNAWLPDHGRVLASGAAVSDVRTIGGDGMLPIFGNSDGFAYADFMGDYGSDNTYLVSPGLGYRKVIDNQIAGAYFFADYEKVSLGENFWVMSPGLEWMNAHWDAHINGYFPTETREQTSDTSVFLSDLGNYSEVSFVNNTHDQYDEKVLPYAVIGNGVDAEVGYGFSGLSELRTRVYVGGYYYAPPNNAIEASDYGDIDNITGVTAGFEQPISKNLKVSLFNSYDNVNNYAVGVALTAMFGQDSTVFSNNIHDRLLDPIERHVGIIDTGAGTYDQQDIQDTGVSALQYDNVYFIGETTEGLGDGTYGNSMMLTQDTLNTIDAETASSRIYLQGDSTYYVNQETTADSSFSVYSPDDYGLHVYAGQSIYGRSANYQAPGVSSEQPIILVDTANQYNGFVITEEGDNTFENLMITSYTAPNTYNTNSISDLSAILEYDYTTSDSSSSTLNIVNTQITGFDNGVYIRSNDANATLNVNITDSTLNDNRYTGLTVINENTGTIIVNTDGSTFNNNGAVTTDGFSLSKSVDGVYLENDVSGTLTMTAIDSEFNQNGLVSGDNSYISGNTSGIFAKNDGAGTLMVTTNNSAFNQNGLASGDSSYIVGNTSGIYILNNGVGNIDLTVNNSTFNANGLASGNNAYITANASGIYARNEGAGSLSITANNSEFNENGVASGTSSLIFDFASGIYAENNGDGEVSISALNSRVNSNGDYGIYARGSSTGITIVDYTGSSLLGNGIAPTNEGENYVTWIHE